MQLQRWLLTALGIGLCVFMAAELVFGGDAKKDEDKIQGTWKAEKDGKTGIMKITGNKFSFNINNGTHTGTFKVNPAAKPKEIDMAVEESPMNDFKGKTSLGIYELNGDALKWCANAPGREGRPKEFSADFLLLEFRREK